MKKKNYFVPKSENLSANLTPDPGKAVTKTVYTARQVSDLLIAFVAWQNWIKALLKRNPQYQRISYVQVSNGNMNPSIRSPVPPPKLKLGHASHHLIPHTQVYRFVCRERVARLYTR